MIAYHVAKAKAGCALNIFEVAAVCPEPHAYMYMGLYTDKDVEELRKLTDAVTPSAARWPSSSGTAASRPSTSSTRATSSRRPTP